MITVILDAGATLVFSLHTLDEGKYEMDNLCSGSFKKKMRSIDAAARLFEASAYSENSYLVQRLAVHTTLQTDNLDEIDAIRDFCHSRGIFFSIAPLANVGNALLYPGLQPNRELLDVTRLGDNSIIHSETSEQICGRQVCGTAIFGMSIGYEGNLLLDAHGGYGIKLANVRTHSFGELCRIRQSVIVEMFHVIKGFCPVRDSERFTEYIKRLNEARTISA
jgi:MoaA/NifB/PqqE/SkfB family radical SAM enzyme